MRTLRILHLAAVMAMLLVLLVLRLAQMQIVQGESWQEEARRSRLHKRAIPFHRGRILDRQGRVLARDRRSYDLMFEYRSFRRGHVAGQLLEAYALLGQTPYGLDGCFQHAEKMAEGMLQWRPSQLRVLPSRSRRDLVFYLRRLFGMPSTDALLEWIESGSGRLADFHPAAQQHFTQRLKAAREAESRLRPWLAQAFWQGYGLENLTRPSFFAALEQERQGLERLIRLKALRMAAGRAMALTAYEVYLLLRKPEQESLSPNELLEAEQERQVFLTQLSRSWGLRDDQASRAELARRLLGRLPDLEQEGDGTETSDIIQRQILESGALLRQVEMVVPEHLAGVRRRLMLEVHRNRVIRLAKNIPFDLVDLLTQNPEAFPGLYTEENPIRDYPASVAPHLVGMVRSASSEDLREYLDLREAYQELRGILERTPQEEERFRRLRDQLFRMVLRPGETRGRSGVEISFEEVLRGQRGYLEVLEAGEENATPKELEFQAPRHGRDVQLGLDAELQRAAEMAIVQGYQHARRRAQLDPKLARLAVPEGLLQPRCGFALIDLQDGSLLVAATSPSFTVDDFRQRYDEIRQPGGPLRQRALGGHYLGPQAPYPGSTFKLVVAVEALSQDRTQWHRMRECLGYYQPKNGKRGLYCDRRAGHLDVAMEEAIMRSCNVYFYKLGEELGYEALYRRSQQLGFGEPTGLRLTQTVGEEGSWQFGGPNAGLERGANFLTEPQFARHSLSPLHLSIGQAYVQASPLQMARFFGWLGTGKLWRPRLVLAAGDTDFAADFQSPAYPDWMRDLLNQAMRGVVEHPFHGTAYDAQFPLAEFFVAGKTGTAQVGGNSEDPRFRVHGWFAAYWPHYEPRFSAAILCENSGLHGGDIASLVLYEFLKSPAMASYQGQLPPPPAPEEPSQ